MFLGGFTGIFRLSSCVLRWVSGKDRPENALPAGILAGLAFGKYRSNNIALYVMWKMLHISYNIAVLKGLVPEVPGFTIFLYCFSTAILFHAAILEPTNLRPSYWKFLHSLSGGRIASMSRASMDAWGFGTSDSLKKVLANTGTKIEVRRIFGL
uniref:Putative secreted protein n=1 Tax=Xenopsylla cheopis TaxID=163159 RepID=A0A6M2E0R9_XENCH